MAVIEPEHVQCYELGVKTTPAANASPQGAYAHTDGKDVSFTKPALPLEEVGAPVAFKNVSGGRLPGISRNALSLGG